MNSEAITNTVADRVEKFAKLHTLNYEFTHEDGAYVWRFAVQPGLVREMQFALSNGDELSFGVADFWSYFFPAPAINDHFFDIVSAWMAGEARIAIFPGRRRRLDIRKNEQWVPVYNANGCLWPSLRGPREFLNNK
ncbi:hypothetical protein [Sphingomicrobium flavum]|uniref:hypothetical protein n=1 Tax=Sphingomicrobium flavum TaxID=1229164 RepID=UPI0021ADADF7|nr:hypothetical protein [Sphingomicrobium flavum]